MAATKFLTIPQLAARLGLSRVAVYKKVKQGQIKAEKVGRVYAISAGEANSVISGKATAADRKFLRKTVRKAVRQYGPVLEWLSKC